MRRLILVPLLLAAACGTPQERCTSSLSREARTLDRLIAETRSNIARGYRYETEVRDTNFGVGVGFCTRSRYTGACLNNGYPSTTTIRRPVAIDPEEEGRKLDGLLLRRERLQDATCTEAGQAVRKKG